MGSDKVHVSMIVSGVAGLLSTTQGRVAAITNPSAIYFYYLRKKYFLRADNRGSRPPDDKRSFAMRCRPLRPS